MSPGLLFRVIAKRADASAQRAGEGLSLRVFQVHAHPGRVIFGDNGFHIPRGNKIEQPLIKFFSFHGSFLDDLKLKPALPRSIALESPFLENPLVFHSDIRTRILARKSIALHTGH
jgi:hypothetical protein